MVAQWDIYYPSPGVKFLNDRSNVAHMMLVVSSQYQFNRLPFYTFVPLTHTKPSVFFVELESADVRVSSTFSNGISNTTNAICGLVYTAEHASFGNKVGTLVNPQKREDVLNAIASRLGIPP